jgi:hypothetical protein
MTEQQREEELLSELLELPEHAGQGQANSTAATQPLLTRHEEQELLKAANQVGTPTLAPTEHELDSQSVSHSFASDLAGVARKYPVLTVLAAGGIAFLVARRRRR